MHFLDPTNDIAFRKIFGDEKRKNVLISFLNSILDLTGSKEIQDVKILDRTQVPLIKGLKETILDVRCTDQRGITYIVEMQVSEPEGFDKRILYYTSKAYASQIKTGEEYPKLNQVIFLGILTFELLKTKDCISNHLIIDKKTQEHYIKDLEFCFVELPKFNKSENELKTVTDKWLYFLKNAKNLKIIPKTLSKDPNIKDAFEVLEEYAWNKEELEIYDLHAIYRQDERGKIQHGYEQGKLEGEEIGIKKLILKMHKNGLSTEQISQITGLKIEEIKKYLQN